MNGIVAAMPDDVRRQFVAELQAKSASPAWLSKVAEDVREPPQGGGRP